MIKYRDSQDQTSNSDFIIERPLGCHAESQPVCAYQIHYIENNYGTILSHMLIFLGSSLISLHLSCLVYQILTHHKNIIFFVV